MPTSSSPRATSLLRGATISSLAVMGSRLLGLVREQIFAFFFGASREYDAFLTAFRIPNLLRDLLAEGALSTAFVTVFVTELEGGDRRRAFRLANLVLCALVALLLGVVAAAMVGAPQLIHLMAGGFDADKAALATGLCRVMFPYIMLAAIAAIFMGMLNAHGLYAMPQSASTFFHLTSICVGLGCAYALAPQYMVSLWQRQPAALAPLAGRAMFGMAIGTLCGGVMQCLIQLPSLRRCGFRFAWAWELSDPAFRRVLRLMGPATLGAAAVQLNVFLNSNFASVLGDRPISWLNYAFRLMQFPIGVFGVAVMTAAVPAMSRAVSRRDQTTFCNTLTQSLELVALLTLPSAVGLWVLGEPIVRLIYEHGRFAPADTTATAAALAAYAVGLPGYAAIKLLQPAFVALGDAKTPMRVSLLSVALGAACNVALIFTFKLGHQGLALSTSAMALLNVSM
ncbi:MAG: murein biosynthesis integral membrane protein MurJ, partial [Deltaproteobacteria bacterium]